MKNLKAENANKKQPGGKLLLLLIPAALVLLTGCAFVFRGWLRATAIPKTATIFYGRSVQRSMNSELAKLQDPFRQLGYITPDAPPAKCLNGRANGLKMEIVCSAKISGYYEISQSEEAKATLNKNASNIQTLLQQNGWEGQYSESGDYTSLKKLVASITAGIDYQPDAAYMKTSNGTYCILDSNTAYASPKPPAIASNIFCTRTFYMFGNPN